jgi:hypothetical protein
LSTAFLNILSVISVILWYGCSFQSSIMARPSALHKRPWLKGFPSNTGSSWPFTNASLSHCKDGASYYTSSSHSQIPSWSATSVDPLSAPSVVHHNQMPIHISVLQWLITVHYDFFVTDFLRLHCSTSFSRLVSNFVAYILSQRSSILATEASISYALAFVISKEAVSFPHDFNLSAKATFLSSLPFRISFNSSWRAAA